MGFVSFMMSGCVMWIPVIAGCWRRFSSCQLLFSGFSPSSRPESDPDATLLPTTRNIRSHLNGAALRSPSFCSSDEKRGFEDLASILYVFFLRSRKQPEFRVRFFDNIAIAASAQIPIGSGRQLILPLFIVSPIVTFHGEIPTAHPT